MGEDMIYKEGVLFYDWNTWDLSELGEFKKS